MSRAYDLNLELRDVTPRVWRSVRVPSDLTLADVHRVIQVLMKWNDVLPHVFDVAGMEYGPEPDEEEISLHWAGEDNAITLAKALQKGDGRFDYTYDFGSERRVAIAMAGEIASAPARIECVEGEGADFDRDDANRRLGEEFAGDRPVAGAAPTPEQQLMADLTLVLLFLGSWQEGKHTRVAYKTMRLEIIDALSEAGLLVTNNHRKSVDLTEEGVKRARALLEKFLSS